METLHVLSPHLKCFSDTVKWPCYGYICLQLCEKAFGHALSQQEDHTERRYDSRGSRSPRCIKSPFMHNVFFGVLGIPTKTFLWHVGLISRSTSSTLMWLSVAAKISWYLVSNRTQTLVFCMSERSLCDPVLNSNPQPLGVFTLFTQTCCNTPLVQVAWNWNWCLYFGCILNPCAPLPDRKGAEPCASVSLTIWRWMTKALLLFLWREAKSSQWPSSGGLQYRS